MSNDFLPFAVGGAANVETQSDYVADTSTLQNGFQSGVANSSKLNKVWRQSSIMAAVLGQFIANTTGKNAVDDGTTATLLANLIAAVSATSPVVVGSARNLAMSVTAASATATLTADEIVVGSAFGGLKYTLAGFSKTINLATTGAGGMDVGSAPVTGYVALYAIWNPSTSTAALLAKNATAGVQTNVYSGANMPAGYTASALIGVWATNASSQFKVGLQRDRKVSFQLTAMLNTGTLNGSPTSFNAAGAFPPNAVRIAGEMSVISTASSAATATVGADANLNGQQACTGGSVSGALSLVNYAVDILTPQTIYYTTANSAGSPTFVFYITSYEF